MNERLELLMTWSAFLLSGFGLNILISVVGVLIGRALGSVLVCMRLSKSSQIVTSLDTMSSYFRNLATLVLVFSLRRSSRMLIVI